MMTILNVAGRGDSLTIRRCAEIAQATDQARSDARPRFAPSCG